MKIMNEEWRDIQGYEGLYLVSCFGSIKGVKRQGSDGRLLKQSLRKDGYLQVPLSKMGKQKHYLVHRLVAIAFIPKIVSECEVNHKDGNRTNNKLDNLEWCTHRENTQHCHDVLRKNTRPVRCVETGVIYPSIRNAARSIHYDNSTIQRICAGKGRSKTAAGFHWEYVQA